MSDAFNYEDIYELFRNEQYSSDLQTLTINDLKKIKKYFEEKNSETKNQDQSLNLFSTHNRAKIQVELSNATRIIKDLLERRERKVISRAVFNSRSDDSMRDTSNMLTVEEELYDKLIKLLRQSRKSFLETIDNDGVAPQPQTTAQIQPVEEKTNNKTYYAQGAIPEFYGPNLEKMGPFKIGDIVSAPPDILDILIPQNKIGLEKPEHSASFDVRQPIEEFKNEVITEDIDNQNEISKTNTDVLSSETVQETHDAQNKTIEKQSSTKNKEKRIE